MAQIIFAFTLNTESKEVAFVGNVEPPVALHILQDIVLSQVASQVRRQRTRKETSEEKKKKEEV